MARNGVNLHRELFPSPVSQDFRDLFDEHGTEVRGKPLKVDYHRYTQIELDGRLIWLVARTRPRDAIGYSCHFWYRDLHFDERIAVDDLWFVLPRWRKAGIGKELKQWGHSLLRAAGVTRVYELVRDDFNHSTLMQDLHFSHWGHRWMKEL